MRLYNYKQSHYNKRHYFADKDPSSQSYGFPSSHVWMWELDYKESWVPKNWSFWTVVLEETPDSPLDSKEIKPVNPKGNQSWIFTEELMLKDILLSNKSIKQTLRIFQREELIPKYKCVLLQLMPYLISLISFVVRLTLLIDMMGCCRSVSSNVFLSPLSLVGSHSLGRAGEEWR